MAKPKHTLKNATVLNMKMAKFSKAVEALMAEHKLTGFKLHQLHFKIDGAGLDCDICEETGLPGTLICDAHTHRCHCECP